MKKGLIMEGGAMRGMFTAGVLDEFMENGIKFDGAIGVSAGAIFGSNFKSHQIGRGIRYNKKYCQDKRYVSYRAWLKTGDLYPVDFCYNVLPTKLDVFDKETYSKDPMDFYVTVTNAETGEPHYVVCNNGDARDIQWMRASASMPIFSNAVNIDGVDYSDGGTSDSVPLKYFESIGYDRNVVIMTQPKGYRKKQYKGLKFIKILLRKHPNLYLAMKNRHLMYNETMDYIDKCEAEKKIFVIRPAEKLQVKPAERNPEELERVYRLGREQGKKYVNDVKSFLNAQYTEGAPHSMDELLDIIHKLRDKETGCAWDSVQTHETLKKCLKDECEEVFEAVDNKDDVNLCEELGDVMLQVLLNAEIAKERGAFSFEDVVQGLTDKLIRRHPHVFGDEKRPDTEEEALALWRKVKEKEKANKK